MPLNVTIKQSGASAYTIRPEGSIDANTHMILGAEVDALLETKSPTMIVFDMKGVTFVSSAGVGVVLVAEKALKLRGGNVLMVNVPPQIRKVFDIVQALPPEQIFSSVEEMDDYLKEMQRRVKEGEI